MKPPRLITSRRRSQLGRELTFKRYYEFRKRKLLDSYIMWALLGSLAAHWFYLERYQEAIAYIIAMVFLCFAAAMVLDSISIILVIYLALKVFEAVYMPILVKNTNKKLYQQLQEDFGVHEPQDKSTF